MSRSGYSEDLEQWALIRWRGAVQSAIRGKRGQAFLREMVAALDAMPVKSLVAGELVTEAGECCAIGAVCLSRSLDVSDVDYDDPEQVAVRVGISEALAQEIEFMNDEWRHHGDPEERWKWMRKWAIENLTKPTPTTP